MLKIGGQLSKSKLKELIKTLPGYNQKICKGMDAQQVEEKHRNSYDDTILTFCAGKGCSFEKTMTFCEANGLSYEYLDYGAKRWTPEDAEPIYSTSTIPASFAEAFMIFMDSIKSIEDLPLHLNDEDPIQYNIQESKQRCIRHALKTGRLDKYELYKVWFKDFLPMKLPRFEWVD